MLVTVTGGFFIYKNYFACSDCDKTVNMDKSQDHKTPEGEVSKTGENSKEPMGAKQKDTKDTNKSPQDVSQSKTNCKNKKDCKKNKKDPKKPIEINKKPTKTKQKK